MVLLVIPGPSVPGQHPSARTPAEPGDTARKVILKEAGYEQVYCDEVITP
jgi:hypothetical protein